MLNALLDRRRLLLGLAAASTAAAVPRIAGAAIAPPAENAELLRLGDALPAVCDEAADAMDARAAIITEWGQRLPVPPAEITFAKFGRSDQMVRDITGYGRDPVRYANSSTDYRRNINRLGAALRRKRPKHPLTASEAAEMQAAIDRETALEAMALDYEAERNRIMAASGYAAAHERERAALRALSVLVRAIMHESPAGMTGVVVQAQAMGAWGAIPVIDQLIGQMDQGLQRYETLWGTTFAANVLRVAGA